MPANIMLNIIIEPIIHTPVCRAEAHQGSEYHPAGTGRPATTPPG